MYSYTNPTPECNIVETDWIEDCESYRVKRFERIYTIEEESE